MSSNLTLKDVALAAGVSEMTASRALRNASDVSNTTRQKVMDTAAALGYVPNRIAGSLASKKVNLVGVVIPSVKSYVFSEVLDGISASLNPSKLRPVFGLTDYSLHCYSCQRAKHCGKSCIDKGYLQTKYHCLPNLRRLK